MTRLPDQDARDRIVFERGRNVVVQAGAGTGKTFTLVSRLVEQVAPRDPDQKPMPLHRIAAITFTRRAAGDLRLQVRRQLFCEIGTTPGDSPRSGRLRNALGALDGAFIGTIHSFCERLLFTRPIETGLGPGHQILEETDRLVKESYRLLLRHVQTGTLAAAVPKELSQRAVEAQETLGGALRSGMLRQTRGSGFQISRGLDSLVEELIEKRDAAIDPPPPPPPSPASILPVIQEVQQAVDRLAGDQRAVRSLRAFVRRLGEIRPSSSPEQLFATLYGAFGRFKQLQTRMSDPQVFPQRDNLAKGLFKALQGRPYQRPQAAFSGRDLEQELTDEVYRWMSTRLLRIAPVVCRLYQSVKREAGVLDLTDLLLLLRGALRDNLEFRRFAQGRFDHLLVDECQDTDPLQMEILAYLAEDGVVADDWKKARLRPGALTVVGDPKQSIYRFRRADIRAYRDFLRLLEDNHARIEQLRCNFRSRPELVREVFNRHGPRLLGRPGDGNQHDGRAPFEPLEPSGRVEAGAGPVLHLLRFKGAKTKGADEHRALEGEAVAQYLSRLLAGDLRLQVRDPATGSLRPPRPGDVAILCRSTTKLNWLQTALNRHRLPHLVRGGNASWNDPLLKRFLLALRAVSDPDDGPAQAAWLGPPFFALTLSDLLWERQDPPQQPAAGREAVQRVRAARQLLQDLRRRRHRRALSETAQDLIEGTGFGACLAVAPNGRTRLSAINQLITLLQAQAEEEGLDFDRASARGRSWVEAPPRFDPAEPDRGDAVRIFTIHQSKGLEFPIVVLWDATSKRSPDRNRTALLFDQESGHWSLGIDRFAYDTSAGLLAEEEKQLDLFEKDRLYYVAVTRARDLLVVTRPDQAAETAPSYHQILTDSLPEDAVRIIRSQPPDQGFLEIQPLPRLEADSETDRLAGEAEADLEQKLKQVCPDRERPAAPSELAHRRLDETQPELLLSPVDADEAGRIEEPVRGKDIEEQGRFGARFGTLVHRCLQLTLSGLSVEEAFRSAAAEVGRVEEKPAREDVRKTLLALRREGLLGTNTRLYPEYPLAGTWHGEDGTLLLSGQLDLVAVSQDSVAIVDFKTDRARVGPAAEEYPRYARQLQIYGAMLEGTGLLEGRTLKLWLLFTQDGRIHPIKPRPPAKS